MKTRGNIGTILVPIDFSPSSINALEYGIRLAESTGSELIIMHAYRLLKPHVKSYTSYGKSLREVLNKEYNEQFRKIEKRLLKDSKVEYEFQLEIGFAADIIESIVQSRVLDLIVMGAKGDGALEKLLGSTTTTVINSTNVPVMVIPEDAKYSELHKLTLASDHHTLKNPEILNIVKELADTFHPEIHILHLNNSISNPPDEDPGSLQFKKELAGEKIFFHFENEPDIEKGILKYCERDNSDLLVMIPRHHNLIESIIRKSYTSKMLRSSRIPVLAIHE